MTRSIDIVTVLAIPSRNKKKPWRKKQNLKPLNALRQASKGQPIVRRQNERAYDQPVVAEIVQVL